MDDSKLSELRLIHKDLATYLNNQHEVMSNSVRSWNALGSSLEIFLSAV